MNEPPLKTFKVATFYEPRQGRKPTASKIQAYTITYNPAWKGCVMYTVEAGQWSRRQIHSDSDVPRQRTRRYIGGGRHGSGQAL